MMVSENLGDRIKRYEAASTYRLPPRQPLIIRVDGRAFHSYTRDMKRPFDHGLMDAMQAAAEKTAADMMGFKLAYLQSDEVTFLLTDYDRLTSQGWFDYEVNKVVSLSASLFTAHFNNQMVYSEMTQGASPHGLATFDSRAFVVPETDIPNVFIWRQRDWERNSLAMLAQSHFPHEQLEGKKRADMHEMLHDIGVNWAGLPERCKNGTFLLRDGATYNDKVDYETVSKYIWDDKDV